MANTRLGKGHVPASRYPALDESSGLSSPGCALRATTVPCRGAVCSGAGGMCPARLTLCNTWIPGPRHLTLYFPSFAPTLLANPRLSPPQTHTSVFSHLAAVPSSLTPLVPQAAVAVPRVAEPHGLGVPKHTHPVPPVATAAWHSQPPPLPASPVSLPMTLASSPRMQPTPSPPHPCLQTSPAR